MSLKTYRRKRDFEVTGEPRGKQEKAKKTRKRQFVVQMHDASRLHYDFRLELDGVLKSWAVPKGPSLDPADKRLAVEVEDHPLEYGDFEGVIPEGQYGAGTVMLWDHGEWTPVDGDPEKALRKGKLTFELSGEKLRGAWTLARMNASTDHKNENGQNWLLIKRSDENVKKSPFPEPPGKSRSVKTKRDMQEIARDDDATWTSPRAAKRRRSPKNRTSPARAKSKTMASESSRAIRADKLTGATERDMPKALRPQLCTPMDTAPAGDAWLHEIKFDGYRLLCWRTPDAVRLLTRTGKEWTKRFTPIAEAIGRLPVKQAILDGEAIVLDKSGRSNFQALQGSIKAQRFDRLAFFAFDLLYCDGYDLTGVTLEDRKSLLHKLLRDDSSGVIRYSEHILGDGAAVQENACKLGLEGIVSKRRDSVYIQARTRNWLKIKCGHRQEFVVIGWTLPAGSRKQFGALLLGTYDDNNRLIYAGRVGTGFNDKLLKDIAAKLSELERETTPADEPPKRSELRGVRWVEPKLVAEVSFTEWTDDGRVRHPSFQGLREDKPARDVRVENAQASPATIVGSKTKTASNTSRKENRMTATRSPGKGKGDKTVIAGVTLSNPDRVLYPEQGLTKADLARYYDTIADLILPHVIDRPLSTVRCPQGRGKPCFFQKHMAQTFGPPITPIRVKDKEKSAAAQYIGIDSRPGLITLIQFGVLEIHPWGSTSDQLEKPDVLTFDLDPGEGVSFADVIVAAKGVRDLLAELGLTSFVKTSGGKGLHVVVPLAPRAEWDEAKAFTAAVAGAMAKQEPGKYLATMSKAKRRGRIFVDYFRNSRGATSVAPWSTRAREGAPVSMPVAWDELEKINSAAHFTVATLMQDGKLISRNAWKDFRRKRQQLTAARLKAALKILNGS